MQLIKNSPYKILSIIGGQHSCGLVYYENGEIKVVLEEERLIRQKSYVDLHSNFFRYPLTSINELINNYGVNLDELDYITSFLEYNVVKDIMSGTVGYNLSPDKFIKTEHHETHCALAYYFSGFDEDTLVIAIDGSGEQHSAKYYLGTNGRMEYIDGIGLDRKSIGMYYCALTELLGFKRLKDEGKVVGLAGHGDYNHDYYKVFKEVLTLEGGLKTQISQFWDQNDLAGGAVYNEIFSRFFNMMGSRLHWKMDDHRKSIAYCGQLVFEETILDILNTLHNMYPNVKKLALSGGIFANVKMNKRINELEWVDEVFITPPMGDEGLPLGSLALTLKKLHPEFKNMLPTVTHPVDKTARIQIVTQETNPFFYNILKKYKELTGIGCLVNTSFNVHNEPIVNKPEEAFKHLKNGIVDFLVTPYGIYSK